LSDPPAGIAIQEVSPDRQGVAIQLSVDAEKAAPGLKGNLIVDAFLERPVYGADGKPRGNTRRIAVGTLPAVPFEVAEP
jgi:hypothetical protein